MKNFTHTDSDSKAKMVDVTSKGETLRQAEVFAEVLVSGEVFRKIKRNEIEKGDVLSTAKIAGIQAAKKTYELIPLCHNIFVSNVDLKIKLNAKRKSIEIRALAKTVSKTGVEMEAMTAASIAALTIYDMCKALDKSIVISDIKLISKTGGKSGDYKASKKLNLNHSKNNLNMQGKVKAISISTQKGVPKTNVKEAKLIKGHGIEGDIHSGKWHRQVSLLAFESIEKMKESGFPKLRPGSFAENITTQSVDIHNIKKGTRIIIGEDTELEITQIGKECHLKCSINIEVGDCIMPKEGVFAKVTKGGIIKVSDNIYVV